MRSSLKLLFALVLVISFLACDSFPGPGSQHTITFDSAGGSPITPVLVENGHAINQPGDPYRSGYYFGGWYPDQTFYKPYNFSSAVYIDFTLYAKWEGAGSKGLDFATVSFNTNGGSEIPSRTVQIGDKISRPVDPVMPGYYLEGWYTDNDTFLSEWDFFNDTVTANLIPLILHAKWEPVVYDTTTYVVTTFWFAPLTNPGGTFITRGRPVGTVLNEDVYSPTAAGYTFDGWYTDPGLTDKFAFESGISRPIYVGLTGLWAKWIPDTAAIFTVSYESNGGSPVDSEEIIDGSNRLYAIQPPDPAKTGYIFSGWYEDNNSFLLPYDFYTPVIGDITLYAKWEPIPVLPEYGTVTFNSNGGSEIPSRTVPLGSTITKPDDPILYGHAFLGWYTDSAMVLDAYEFARPITGNLTLYAKWEKLATVTVVFNCNGGIIRGQVMTDIDKFVMDIPLGEKIFPPDPVTLRREYSPTDPPHSIGGGDRYVFIDWYSDNVTFLNKFDFSVPVAGTQTITIYAKWLPDYMTKINSGEFMMGTLISDPGSLASERPQHEVKISKFYLSSYQVTRELWAYVMSHPMFSATPDPNPSRSTSVGTNLPVETISWYEALVFCNRLSIIEGLAPVYTISNTTNPDNWGTKGQIPVNASTVWDRVTVDNNACGFRMPTEAEWEYACKADTTTPYRTGSAITASQANFNNSTTGTTVVGSYPENLWDLYDMHGNVWEWCWDWFNEKDYYATSPVQDPPGPSSSGTSGGTRVLRGGCYNSDALATRSANRFRHIPPYKVNVNNISDYQGLRIGCKADF